MNDPLLVRRFERLGDLPRDRQRLVERNRAARDPLRQVLALDELHDERGDALGFFESIDRRDVRMIQRGEDFGFALEPREPIVIRRDRGRENLDRDLSVSACCRSPDTPGPSRLRRSAP